MKDSIGFNKPQCCTRCLRQLSAKRAEYEVVDQEQPARLCPSCQSVSQVEATWMPISGGSSIGAIFRVPNKKPEEFKN